MDPDGPDKLDLSASPGAPRPRKGGRGLVLFVVGLAAGIAGTVLVPRYLTPYLPDALRASRVRISGSVVGKRTEPDRLLLTIRAPEGATLATFTRRVSEIDLLVAEGDSVTLRVARYEPFVKDPVLEGVHKPAGTSAAPDSSALPHARPPPDTSSAGAREPG